MRNPDLILLDLGLPDMNSTEVVRRVRAWASMPILLLSASDREQAEGAALDLGADDYITKPFNVDELLARMRVALRYAARHPGEGTAGSCTFGDLTVDLGRRQVFTSGKQIHLTPTEYKLLATLVRQAGKVMTHRQLLTEVWRPTCVEEGHYLRVSIRQLRSKVEADPSRPRHLVTELGFGYRLRTT